MAQHADTMRHVFRRLLQKIFCVVDGISANHFVGCDADPNFIVVCFRTKGSDYHMLRQ